MAAAPAKATPWWASGDAVWLLKSEMLPGKWPSPIHHKYPYGFYAWILNRRDAPETNPENEDEFILPLQAYMEHVGLMPELYRKDHWRNLVTFYAKVPKSYNGQTPIMIAMGRHVYLEETTEWVPTEMIVGKPFKEEIQDVMLSHVMEKVPERDYPSHWRFKDTPMRDFHQLRLPRTKETPHRGVPSLRALAAGSILNAPAAAVEYAQRTGKSTSTPALSKKEAKLLERNYFKSQKPKDNTPSRSELRKMEKFFGLESSFQDVC
mgnify:CR=1 FL=1